MHLASDDVHIYGILNLEANQTPPWGHVIPCVLMYQGWMKQKITNLPIRQRMTFDISFLAIMALGPVLSARSQYVSIPQQFRC